MLWFELDSSSEKLTITVGRVAEVGALEVLKHHLAVLLFLLGRPASMRTEISCGPKEE